MKTKNVNNAGDSYRLAKEDIGEIVSLILSDSRAARKVEEPDHLRIFEQFFTNHLQRNFNSEFFAKNSNETVANEFQEAALVKEFSAREVVQLVAEKESRRK